MSTTSTPPAADDATLPAGTTKTYQRLHNWIRRGVYVCMFALVVEGTLFVPFLVVWYGWPTLSMHQICDELYKVMYADEAKACRYPYPLSGPPFGGPAENEGQTTAHHTWGIQPKPHYPRLGFRELIEVRHQREARDAEKHAATQPSK